MSTEQEDARFWPQDPYKGLNYYGARDAPLFCEREEEIETCAQLLGSPATKLLLLHGRSGTGKSSFLRAGLFAKSLRANPTLYLMVEKGEPCFIRSTADPIGSVTEMFLSRIANTAFFPGVSAATRSTAVEILRQAERGKPAERGTALRSCLEHVTAELVGTLVLVIDQAEEVFTLESRGGSTAERHAYFAFLEKLCFDRFDIKAVLALRTEYYGQFADSFRVPPNLRISPVVSGLEQYMLQGVQKQERLKAAIEWPTSENPVDDLEPPRTVYRFKYTENLSSRIAADIVQHCGESSALPVLQIVCSDLYDRLPRLTDEQQAAGVLREIKADDYRDGGEVPGAIDRYIERTIVGAVLSRTEGSTNQPDKASKKNKKIIDGWKHIVSSLVTRQEGGALTSLLLSHEALKEKANEAGLSGSIDQCLEKLSGTKTRLLRSVPLHDRTTGHAVMHYSLGHDALAPSLFGWQETRGKAIEDRAKVRRRAALWLGVSGVATAVLLLMGLVILLWIASRSHALSLRASLQTIMGEPVVGLRILRLATLIENTPTYWRTFIPRVMDDMNDALRDTLLRAPIVSETGITAAVAADGKRLVVVTREGSVLVRRLGASTERSLAYVVPVGNPYMTAGFIDSLHPPVVSANSHLYFGRDKSIRIDRLIPGAVSFTPAYFHGDTLELTSVNPAEQSVFAYDIRYEDEGETLRASAPIKAEVTPNANGVSSPYGPLEAFSEGDEEYRPLAQRGTVSVFVRTRGELQRTLVFSRKALSPAKDLRPVSIAFLPGNRKVAIRPATDTVAFIELTTTGSDRQVVNRSLASSRVSEALLPPIPPQQQIGALLAAVQTSSGYRVAWLNERGVVLVEAGQDGQFATWPVGSANAPLLTSMQLADALSPFMQITFDDTGNFLTLSMGPSLHAWDVSERRVSQLRDMQSSQELIDEACRVIALSGELPYGNRLPDEEFDRLPVSAHKQPCEKGK